MCTCVIPCRAVQWTEAMYDDYMWTGSTAANVDLWWLQLTWFWGNALGNLDARGVWYTSNVRADIRGVRVHVCV